VRELYEKHWAKVHYLLVGGWNTFFGYSVFITLYYVTASFNVHYEVVLVLSQIINVTSAYLFYKKFVFKTKGNYFQEYFRFWQFYWLSLVVNLVSLPVLVELLHLNLILSQGLLTVATGVSSYFWHTNHTFSLANRVGSR
jgi:putative flippase GtrA